MDARRLRAPPICVRVTFGFEALGATLVMRRLVAAAVVLSLALAATAAAALSPQERQGRALATRLCASCHAVGPRGDSPHIGAPRFRQLDRRLDLDGFVDRLRGGLTSGHPDMPTFRFTRADAGALVAYLRAIAAP